MMASSSVTDLVSIFRAGLLALLPVMDRAGIRWQGEGVYDPWEEIERTLFKSIVGCCVENSVAPSLPSLAPYGMMLSSWANHSFITVAAPGTPCGALLQLVTVSAPFDEAVLVELDADLVPSKREFRRSVDGTSFLLATPAEKGKLILHEHISYEE